MFGWFRRRREYRNRVKNKASRLIEALGDDAWPTIYRESRDLGLSEEERLFHLAVRREVEKRLGIEPRTDVATRYTDQLSVVLLLAVVFSLRPVVLTDETWIIGEARVIDGDTLDVGPVRIRLHGIDAPEAGQRCGQWHCGDRAAAARRPITHHGRHGTTARSLTNLKVSAGSAMRPTPRPPGGVPLSGDDRL